MKKNSPTAKNGIFAKPLKALSATATELKNEARTQGSKLGAKLVYEASDLGLNLLHKATGSSNGIPAHAIAIIKMDHEKVKELFDQFEKAEDRRSKKKIVAEALQELKVHATMEESLFYPAVREEIDDKEGLMEEADEEHHVAKVLIAELEKMKGHESYYDAKFTVLSENIRHHIKEEESEMLPKAAKTQIDMVELGARMWRLKQKLLANGVPPDAESKMIQRSGLRGDSPAKNAQKKIDVPLLKKTR